MTVIPEYAPAPLCVVIPVRNDAPALAALLPKLESARSARLAEVVVVDGGSHDDSRAVALRHGCRVIDSPAGRGLQLATGIAAASTGAAGPWLWLLHADASPTPAVWRYLERLPATPPGWGRFDVDFAAGAGLAVVAFFMNRRSCLTGICTGDQGIFVHREVLDRAGGMPAQPLMEDVELSRRLKRLARPRCRRERLGASARRWQRRGLVRTVLTMWWFRLRYWLGADPERLAAEYYRP
jgi:rSAM/selenodomain-associated transferase 2